jgi:hypothetical protein
MFSSALILSWNSSKHAHNTTQLIGKPSEKLITKLGTTLIAERIIKRITNSSQTSSRSSSQDSARSSSQQSQNSWQNSSQNSSHTSSQNSSRSSNRNEPPRAFFAHTAIEVASYLSRHKLKYSSVGSGRISHLASPWSELQKFKSACHSGSLSPRCSTLFRHAAALVACGSLPHLGTYTQHTLRQRTVGCFSHIHHCPTHSHTHKGLYSDIPKGSSMSFHTQHYNWAMSKFWCKLLITTRN